MEPRSVARFPAFIQMIGCFIAIPSALGMFSGASVILSGNGAGLVIGGAIFIASAIGGLIATAIYREGLRFPVGYYSCAKKGGCAVDVGSCWIEREHILTKIQPISMEPILLNRHFALQPRRVWVFNSSNSIIMAPNSIKKKAPAQPIIFASEPISALHHVVSTAIGAFVCVNNS